MTNDNTFDDFDTTITAEEFYTGDDIPCYECGGFLDNHQPECPEVPTP